MEVASKGGFEFEGPIRSNGCDFRLQQLIVILATLIVLGCLAMGGPQYTLLIELVFSVLRIVSGNLDDEERATYHSQVILVRLEIQLAGLSDHLCHQHSHFYSLKEFQVLFLPEWPV